MRASVGIPFKIDKADTFQQKVATVNRNGRSTIIAMLLEPAPNCPRRTYF
jgi:hypothetical protein